MPFRTIAFSFACLAVVLPWAGSTSIEVLPKFAGVTAQSGIRFQHHNGASPEKYLVETMGSGCAFLDFDQDGRLDVLFVDGGPTPAYQPKVLPRTRLFRSRGDGTFSDVTMAAGIRANPAYAMGVAVGDFDNDGFPDLYISGFRFSALYRNNRRGGFTEIGDQAGVRNRAQWGSSAAWFDLDNDGYLDLIVANYLDYEYARNLHCGEKSPGARMYCHPQNYDGVYPTLYRNNRDGTFSDVTERAGLAGFKCKGLGVVAADFNNDGWTDIFIANDSIRNTLYLNRGNGTFEDVSLPSGTGYSADGRAEAGMGVDAADYDGDGLLDIFVTHLDFELNRLYRNLGQMSFSDETIASALGRTAVLYSGFGTRFVDFDNDGWRDLAVANGHVLDNVSRYRPDVQYAEPKLLYRNAGGRFSNMSEKAGEAFRQPRVGRGLATGDYDNDGDVDLLVSNNGGPGELIRNDTNTTNGWIAIRLIGTKSNRDAVGARVKVVSARLTQFDQVKGGGSYLSASDPRLYFGLGNHNVVDLIEVRWPSGMVDTIRDVPARRCIAIQEGAGERACLFPGFR